VVEASVGCGQSVGVRPVSSDVNL